MPILRTAAEAERLAHKARPLVPSPPAFDGPLDAFAERFVVPNLPTADDVEVFHEALVRYVTRPDALLLVRAVRGTTRREVYETADGTRFRATDNAPAWWTHAALAQGYRVAPEAFGDVVATMPAHFHDVGRTCAPTASAAGWHVAHIFAVKDRATDYRAWTRPDVIGRFVRSVHPCNYFLLAKRNWQRWGAEPTVVGFFAAFYAERYSAVWRDFGRLARVDVAAVARAPRTSVRYTYPGPDPGPAVQFAGEPAARAEAPGGTSAHPASPLRSGPAAAGSACAVEYRASRLMFKRDVIEPLLDGDRFRVATPAGTFEMTKAQFCRTFPRVRSSRSYREVGTYHYPSVPAAAAAFRVEPSAGS